MIHSKASFILYKPAVPGNIGASARALKTMGFNDLRLVDPADHLTAEAKMFAHGSHEILEQCKVYNSFDESIKDIDFIICTSAKQKSAKVVYLPSNHLGNFLKEKLPLVNKFAVVFGSEESGLPNFIILKSNIGVTIPMALNYPSLNLAQAVMIIAYELSLSEQSNISVPNESQTDSTWNQLQKRSSYILDEIGIKPSTPLYHRILERMSFMKASDARLAHSISSKLFEQLRKDKNPE